MDELLIDRVWRKLHEGHWAREMAAMVGGLNDSERSLYRNVCGEFLSLLRKDLEVAERYVIDNSLVSRMLHLEVPTAEQIGGQISAAEPKHDVIWIEYDNIFKVSTQNSEFFRPGGLNDQTPPLVGWLVKKLDGHGFWEALCITQDASGPISVFPLTFVFNSNLTGEPKFNKKTFWQDDSGVWNQWRGQCFGYHDGRHYLCPPMVRDSFSIGVEPTWRWYITRTFENGYASGESLARLLKFLVYQSGGDALWIVTFLALLNEVPGTVQIPRKSEGSVRSPYKGDPPTKDMLETKYVRVELPKRVRATYLDRQMRRVIAAHTKKKWHLVVGHERVIHRGTEAERTVKVRAHARGDKRLGEVRTVHVATDSGVAR